MQTFLRGFLFSKLNMGGQIIPYQDRTDIAIVDRNLSKVVQKGFHKEAPDVIRVTDVFVGRYGNLGYVEMNVGRAPEKFDVGGIIEIPEGLVRMMKRVPGMTGYITEVVFQNDDFAKRKESLDHPFLRGVELFDVGYFWHPLGYLTVNGDGVPIKMKDCEGDVIKFIVDFEKVLDKFAKEQTPDLQTLLSLGTQRLLEEFKGE